MALPLAWHYCLAPGAALLVKASWGALELLLPDALLGGLSSNKPQESETEISAQGQGEMKRETQPLATTGEGGEGRVRSTVLSHLYPKDLIPFIFPLLHFSEGENKLWSMLIVDL